MKCNSCGTENEVGTKFCASCGSLLNTDSETTTEETVENTPTPESEPAAVNDTIPTKPSEQANTKTIDSKHISEVMIGGIVASCIFILGIFLPYARIAFAEMSLIQGGIVSDAGIALILGLLSLGAAITKRPVTILIMGILNSGFVILKTLTLSSRMSGASFFGVDMSKMVSYGIGYYCLWIGAGILVVVGIYGIIRRVNGNKTTENK